MACTLIGTLCRFSDRFWAVTTISSRAVPAAVWAKAGAAAAVSIDVASRPSVRSVFSLISIPQGNEEASVRRRLGIHIENRSQAGLQRAEPGFEVAPVVGCIGKYWLAHLLGAGGADR